ncbi:hypothetical protein, partial [Winkia sp. UMB0889B]|uniref:hypothetical protein n=1 Tax=Winkia sp. UMB0889B TaxID=3046315 RepID=UPI002555C9DA
GKVHQRFHFTPPEVHARSYIAITSSLIEYLLAKLLSFQGFIVIFGVGSLSNTQVYFFNITTNHTKRESNFLVRPP